MKPSKTESASDGSKTRVGEGEVSVRMWCWIKQKKRQVHEPSSIPTPNLWCSILNWSGVDPSLNHIRELATWWSTWAAENIHTSKTGSYKIYEIILTFIKCHSIVRRKLGVMSALLKVCDTKLNMCKWFITTFLAFMACDMLKFPQPCFLFVVLLNILQQKNPDCD
jgi:hypothetical protein